MVEDRRNEMIEICRFQLPDVQMTSSLVNCFIEGEYMVLQIPTQAVIFDSLDLCQYTGCRRAVATSARTKQKLKYCYYHVEYSRKMQKQNYARQQEKIRKGICAMYDCERPRAPNKKSTGKLGRVCVEHALQNNERSRKFYQNKKKRKKILIEQ